MNCWDRRAEEAAMLGHDLGRAAALAAIAVVLLLAGLGWAGVLR